MVTVEPSGSKRAAAMSDCADTIALKINNDARMVIVFLSNMIFLF